ncbi:hypothetical protein [Streptomyces sp. cg36]
MNDRAVREPTLFLLAALVGEPHHGYATAREVVVIPGSGGSRPEPPG